MTLVNNYTYLIGFHSFCNTVSFQLLV